MPSAAQYFNKASIESGPGVRMMDKETAHENILQLLKELNIPVNNWKKILEVPASELLSMQAKLPMVAPFQEKNKNQGMMRRNAGGFVPVVDGKALPNHPFDPGAPEISRNKPLLVGWNEDEYTFFAWERKDTESFKIDFDGLYNKLEPQYGQDTKKNYRNLPQGKAERHCTRYFCGYFFYNYDGPRFNRYCRKENKAKRSSCLSVQFWV